MQLKNLFEELLFITDTCQAFTFYKQSLKLITNATFIGSSLLNQMAKSLFFIKEIGQGSADRFTFFFQQALEKSNYEKDNLSRVLHWLDYKKLKSEWGVHPKAKP